MLTYEQQHDTVVTHVWETWTQNGLGLDPDEQAQTLQSVQDAATNAYTENAVLHEWAAATLRRLNGCSIGYCLEELYP
jgi:hypothetical protein